MKGAPLPNQCYEESNLTYSSDYRFLKNDGFYNYTYDADGYLIHKEMESNSTIYWDYEWDAAGNLRKVTKSDGYTEEYIYDENNTKIRAITPDETISYVYDGNQLVYETSTKDGVKESVYAFKELQMVYIENEDKQTYYYSDILGSTRFVTDDQGTPIQENIFDPFGKEVLNANRVGGAKYKYRYAGHESMNLKTGLSYMKARWMDPSTGRFISPDPARQGINYYIYAGDNPTTMVDPSGLWHYEGSTMEPDPGDEGDYEDTFPDGDSDSGGGGGSDTPSTPTWQEQWNDLLEKMKQRREEIKNEIAKNHQDFLDKQHQRRLANGYYDNMRKYNDWLGGLKNKQDEYNIHDADALALFLDYKDGLLDPKTFGNSEFDATVMADIAEPLKDTNGNPVKLAMNSDEYQKWFKFLGIDSGEKSEVEMAETLKIDMKLIDEIAGELLGVPIGKVINNAGTRASVSCAMTVMVKILIVQYEKESKKQATRGDVKTIMKGWKDALPTMLNSLPSLEGFSMKEFLQKGWDALGMKNNWAGGTWLTDTTNKKWETEWKKKSSWYPTKYYVNEVQTKYSNVGGSHYIVQIPGMSGYFDPATGGFITSYENVNGYKEGTEPKITPVAF